MLNKYRTLTMNNSEYMNTAVDSKYAKALNIGILGPALLRLNHKLIFFTFIQGIRGFSYISVQVEHYRFAPFSL